MAGNKNSGGRRVGSGRKPKPRYDKIRDGETVDIASVEICENVVILDGVNNVVLTQTQADGSVLQATEIYKKTWDWICERGCAVMVSPQLLDRYAMMCARWLHCEEHISKNGYLGTHPTTGGEIQSPYVKMSFDYLSQTNRLWLEIYGIVKENCSGDYSVGVEEVDPMEALLKEK